MAKILFVDDDKEHAKLVTDWLTFEKHTVTSAKCGFEAWNHLQEESFDLAIFDWDLPDLDGIDILHRLRSSGDKTPVIMLTGRSSIDDKERGLDSGATDYLTKPFHMKELSARVRAAIRDSQTSPVHKALGTNNEDLLAKGNLSGTALAARLEFLEILGAGGAGMVFKARHPHLSKFVAVKMLHASEQNDESIARFEREAQVISSLEHPNIITVYDFGVTEHKSPYMVMEYIEGKSLEDLLAERDFIEIEEALPLMIDIADGISFAHENQILHRDIKPANVMLKSLGGRAPIPKVLDFGLAKVQSHSDKDASIALTREQQVFGSPPYMSPEQIKGKQIDTRADIYSFGCMLFQVLSGYPPFCGDSAQEMLALHLSEAPLTFKEVRPELNYPESLQKLILRCLAKNPDERYQSMNELKQDLSTNFKSLENVKRQLN